MNEFQVAIGETTCAAKFWAAPTSAGGKAQVEVRDLSRYVDNSTSCTDLFSYISGLRQYDNVILIHSMVFI